MSLPSFESRSSTSNPMTHRPLLLTKANLINKHSKIHVFWLKTSQQRSTGSNQFKAT